MAFSEELAERIREVVRGRGGITEKRMFGGLAFLVRGHMACGVVGEELMVRVGADAYEGALALPHVRAMDFTGRPLRGFVYVAPRGLARDGDLASWVKRGLEFVATLPPKG